jgi:carbon monoxide dehydrogenase subunit G
MPEAQKSVTIARPVDAVFAFVADSENDRRWRPAVLDITRLSGEGRGTVYRQGVKGPFGRRVPADFEVTDYEPGTRYGFQVTQGPVRPHGSFSFQPDGGGTLVTMHLAADLRGPAKLMGPMVSRSMRNEVGALANLKQVLESGAPS